MFNSNSYVAKGVVLKGVNVGEADRILTIFSDSRGKIRAMGRGLRKIDSRRGGNLEVFNLIKGRFVSGRTFDVITEVETLQTHKSLRNNLLGAGIAFQMVEVVYRLSAEEVENREVFDLLVEGLKRVDQGVFSKESFLGDFAVEVLRALGYWPREKGFGGDWKRYVESVAEYPLRSPRILTRLGEVLQSK